MFNIKRKITDALKDENVLIQQIHNDFDSATERLLTEAKQILSKEVKTDIVDRLKKVGFGSSKTVAKNIQIQSDIRQSEETAKHIGYYSQYYPNNKFITEEAVKKICMKYGLIFGEVGYFIGEVPVKNLEEIERFSLRDEDKTKKTYGWYNKVESDRRYDDLWAAQADPFRGFGATFVSRSIHFIPTSQKAPDSMWGFIEGFSNFYGKPLDETHHYESSPFMIVAAKSDFNTDRMRIEDGYKLQEIKDPIVLQPVKGGYLIVTKWGLEASDELVVNEKMN